jgi:glycosyltransferase A (GT-A) superfamily protein (DUF2064 family)
VAAAPAVLLMAGAARSRPDLRDLLGDERVAAIERLLVARATDWAEALSGGRVHRAGGAEPLAEAVQRVFADAPGGPVVIVWPVLPCWRPAHAVAVLDDLAAGCEASVAPVFDGGLYLLALARVIPALLDLPDGAWDSPDAMGLVLAAINEAGAAVGLVRPERALRRPGDVRAALADPLLDHELRSLLEV